MELTTFLLLHSRRDVSSFFFFIHNGKAEAILEVTRLDGRIERNWFALGAITPNGMEKKSTVSKQLKILKRRVDRG